MFKARVFFQFKTTTILLSSQSRSLLRSSSTIATHNSLQPSATTKHRKKLSSKLKQVYSPYSKVTKLRANSCVRGMTLKRNFLERRKSKMLRSEGRLQRVLNALTRWTVEVGSFLDLDAPLSQHGWELLLSTCELLTRHLISIQALTVLSLRTS